MLTQERLKEVLAYNAETGIFTWKISTSNRTKVGTIAGYTNTKGYIIIGIDGKQSYAHRLAFLYVYGKFPDNTIDHINQIRTNNRISNLRDVTHQENMKNQSLRSNNTGIMGIWFDKTRNKWQVKIQVDGKTKNLGRFTNKEDAIKARELANKKYNYHENHGRIQGVKL